MSGDNPSESHAEGSSNESAASGSSSGLTRTLPRFFEGIIGSADRLVEVYADRIRLSVRRTIVHAAVGAGVAVCAAVCLSAAGLAIVRGVSAGLTTLWGGREWLGDLSGGVLVCTLGASALALYFHRSSRRELARLKVKYERIRNENNNDQNTSSPGGDGGGVP